MTDEELPPLADIAAQAAPKRELVKSLRKKAARVGLEKKYDNLRKEAYRLKLHGIPHKEYIDEKLGDEVLDALKRKSEKRHTEAYEKANTRSGQLETLSMMVPLSKKASKAAIVEWICNHLQAEAANIIHENIPCRSAVRALILAEEDIAYRRKLFTLLIDPTINDASDDQEAEEATEPDDEDEALIKLARRMERPLAPDRTS